MSFKFLWFSVCVFMPLNIANMLPWIYSYPKYKTRYMLHAIHSIFFPLLSFFLVFRFDTLPTSIHIIIYIFRVKSFPFHFLMHYSCAYFMCFFSLASHSHFSRSPFPFEPNIPPFIIHESSEYMTDCLSSIGL